MSILHCPVDAALELRERGWQPVRLHGLRADGTSCTCRRGAACKVAGKHPTDRGWQDAPMPTSAEIKAAWRGWRSGHNVSIGTGKRSGLFVLDVDPDNGGVESLAALEALHGALPETFKVRTGGGGWHLYFRWPGFPVGNSAGRLGPGLDVRGNGGQVVAPPSRSAKGTYRLDVDAPLADAPTWLLDRLRPVARPTPSPSTPRRGRLLRRVAALVQVVMDGAEGSRNSRLYWASRRMAEVIADGGLTADEARACLVLAGQAVGLDADEVSATVASGLRTAS